MFKFILSTALLIFTTTAQAELTHLKSHLYRGELNRNGHPLHQICYVQVNDIQAFPNKGHHCQVMQVQLMFNLEDKGIHDRGTEVTMISRKTNSEADFHKPTTCAEVTADVANPWTINKWGEDTTYLYNQVFNAKMKAPKGENHYTLIFDGVEKSPSRAMIHNVQWFSENSYECTDLEAL